MKLSPCCYVTHPCSFPAHLPVEWPLCTSSLLLRSPWACLCIPCNRWRICCHIPHASQCQCQLILSLYVLPCLLASMRAARACHIHFSGAAADASPSRRIFFLPHSVFFPASSSSPDAGPTSSLLSRTLLPHAVPTYLCQPLVHGSCPAPLLQASTQPTPLPHFQPSLRLSQHCLASHVHIHPSHPSFPLPFLLACSICAMLKTHATQMQRQSCRCPAV